MCVSMLLFCLCFFVFALLAYSKSEHERDKTYRNVWNPSMCMRVTLFRLFTVCGLCERVSCIVLCKQKWWVYWLYYKFKKVNKGMKKPAERNDEYFEKFFVIQFNAEGYFIRKITIASLLLSISISTAF